MDEPTNHLDLTTREALSMALNEFEGTVMLVSHDRALLREVCDEFWLVSHGAVLPFDGDLDDYQKWLLETSRAISRGAPPPPLPGNLNDLLPPSAAPAPATPKQGKGGKRGPYIDPNAAAAPIAAPPPVASNTKPGAARNDDRKQSAQQRTQVATQTRPLRAEVQQIDIRMEKLAAEKAELEAAMATGKLSGSEIADAGRRLAHAGAEVARLEERWLELNEQIEALQAGS
jgi:ATP-binding cassette subfamily F protein 3